MTTHKTLFFLFAILHFASPSHACSLLLENATYPEFVTRFEQWSKVELGLFQLPSSPIERERLQDHVAAFFVEDPFHHQNAKGIVGKVLRIPNFKKDSPRFFEVELKKNKIYLIHPQFVKEIRVQDNSRAANTPESFRNQYANAAVLELGLWNLPKMPLSPKTRVAILSETAPGQFTIAVGRLYSIPLLNSDEHTTFDLIQSDGSLKHVPFLGVREIRKL